MWQILALFIIVAAVIGVIAYGIRERIRFGKLAEQVPPHMPNRRHWYK
jgi:hypothetical protein